MTLDPGMPTTTEQEAAVIARQNALDRLRSLLGPAFSGAQVTTEYGAPAALTGKEHTGLDLAAAEGTPVQLPIGGTVESAFHDNTGGNQVIIRTPEGYRQIFAHLSAFHPSANMPGQSVPPGAVIGYVGQTGMATGPHLHYEVQKPGGELGTMFGSIDPLAFIGEFIAAPSVTGPGQPRMTAVRPSGGTDYAQRTGERSGAPADPCTGVSADIIKKISQFIYQPGIAYYSSGAAVADALRAAFPSTPVACMRQVVNAEATNPTGAWLGPWAPDIGAGARSIVGGLDIPVLTGLNLIAKDLDKLTGDLTDTQRWARYGLTAVAVGLIIAGLVFFAGGFRANGRQASQA